MKDLILALEVYFNKGKQKGCPQQRFQCQNSQSRIGMGSNETEEGHCRVRRLQQFSFENEFPR